MLQAAPHPAIRTESTAMPQSWEWLPPIDLRQLLRLTDDTGIFQHAMFAAPDPNHGYCIDDNARALVAALLHAQMRGHDDRVVPLTRYLSFLVYAYNEKNGVFRNFMGYDRRWLEDEGSPDSQGRTIWALGLAVRLAPDQLARELATNLMKRALPSTERLDHMHSRAFALIGLNEYLCAQPDDDHARRIRDNHAAALYDAFARHATEDWPWWSDLVTYDNAKLSHALMVSGSAMNRDDMLTMGLQSLQWLLRVQTAPRGHLSIIGNNGWLRRGGEKAAFDQQPLEAYAMVHGCLAAAGITGDDRWADHAWTCFRWFHGYNDLDLPLYHHDTGGCQDGLHQAGPNRNQGAESTLAYLLCTLELHRYRIARSLRP
jgi:hypothetical protein